jgi:hypothetical protein
MTSTREPSTQSPESTDDVAALQELPEPSTDHDTADPTCATTGYFDGHDEGGAAVHPSPAPVPAPEPGEEC